VPIIQGWGMTETSPLAALALPPPGCLPEEQMHYRVKAGRVVGGVEVRVVDDDGEILANDGESVGEFEIRGRGSPPPITGTTTRRNSATVGCGRRRRHARPPGLHDHHGPDEGRHKIRRRVDLFR